MMENNMTVLGWDIGGAHVKAVRRQQGQIVAAHQYPCPLWRGLEHLDAAIAQALADLGDAPCHAATMTGELADIFSSRADGVTTLSARLAQSLPRLKLYGGRAGWILPEHAGQHTDDIASANWHASASLAARHVRDGLLIDMGSTTTDLILLRDGKIADIGYTDAGRLESGELVYTGMVRTPVMAIASHAPLNGRITALTAEYFATAADIYRILGWLDEAADQYPSADGGAKSCEGSHRRLARMAGADAGDFSDTTMRSFAEWLHESQLRRIQDAAMLLLSNGPLSAEAPVIGAGIGIRVLEKLAARLGRPFQRFGNLPGLGGDGSFAPAIAVAMLLT
ncbi:Hydantoinase/oxoprolinase family protein [Granulibacter bethesdensis]|uniref:hydantoinase/oxoprolinase family protein n=1 Tax=Granulibacter bethesdensis TaxID=364410 RepID=UPI00090B55FB|nr:hydantoinase/oxoprolinase family protein [Granulibacter bethesdensis]APH56581.1 Hydantoinase/oxoprolinase family protein [Granulibacter bethesdensis]